MTKKDFEQLAAFIREQDGMFAHNIAHARFTANLADELSTNHPRFNRAKFIEACKPRWMIGTWSEQAWDRRVANTK